MVIENILHRNWLEYEDIIGRYMRFDISYSRCFVEENPSEQFKITDTVNSAYRRHVAFRGRCLVFFSAVCKLFPWIDVC